MSLYKTSLATLINVILLTNLAFADDVIVLEQGKPAPSTGLFLPQDKAQQYRKDLLDLDYTKLINTSLNKSLLELETKVQKKDEQLNLYIEQNDKLAKSSYNLQQNKDLERIGLFVLGILTMYGASKLP